MMKQNVEKPTMPNTNFLSRMCVSYINFHMEQEEEEEERQKKMERIQSSYSNYYIENLNWIAAKHFSKWSMRKIYLTN